MILFSAMKTSYIVLFPLLAISCGHPGVPANAVLSGDKFTYGSIIHYSCTAGRRLIGNSTRECQEDSHWSGTLPHCSGTCTNHHLDITLCHMDKAILKQLLTTVKYLVWVFPKHILISPIATQLNCSHLLKYSHMLSYSLCHYFISFLSS